MFGQKNSKYNNLKLYFKLEKQLMTCFLRSLFTFELVCYLKKKTPNTTLSSIPSNNIKKIRNWNVWLTPCIFILLLRMSTFTHKAHVVVHAFGLITVKLVDKTTKIQLTRLQLPTIIHKMFQNPHGLLMKLDECYSIDRI